MAEIIPLQSILRARRRQSDHARLQRCVRVIEQSLQIHLEEFTAAPAEEKAVRASKIRKLGELLEYATHLS
jgi:hypothetical protein